MITHAISVRIPLGLYEATERVVADAQAITTPVQPLISGSDWVVHHKPQHDFYSRLGNRIKERHILPDFYRDTLGEQNRGIALVEMHRFIRERFDQPLYQVDLTQAHLHGESHREADELATPLSICLSYGAFRAVYRIPLDLGARWSEGLKTDKETGYDSGSTLDYVYRNQPQDNNAFDVAADKYYLNAIGWRGIRQRRISIGKTVQTASTELREAGKPVHVPDIASGHERYVFDVLIADMLPNFMRSRDYSPTNVEVGRKLTVERGLQDTATFDEVNVYNRANYQDFQPRPTLGIVSDLHELFADNDLILNSPYGFGDVIETGGYPIYTGQPWHPRPEMIARALTSHKAGSPNWVMRRRSQQEMDQLVEKTGLGKIYQRIDENGIFTVNLVVKG